MLDLICDTEPDYKFYIFLAFSSDGRQLQLLLNFMLISSLRYRASRSHNQLKVYSVTIYHCDNITDSVVSMLGLSHDLELVDDAERVQEIAMTSLAKLVFVDTHSRKNVQNGTTENETDSLSLAFENLFHMPFDIIETYGGTLKTLDISHNKFSRNLQFLAEFDNMTSLNLDHNNIDSYSIFPPMPKLQLLWLNHNKIDDLYPFIKHLYTSVPNLRYLCIMGNKAMPSYLNGGSFYEYLQSRLFVISWFPHLVHLDDRAVTPEQRTEAKRLFRRPLLDQIAGTTQIPECLKHLHNKMSYIFSKPTLPETTKVSKGPNFVI